MVAAEQIRDVGEPGLDAARWPRSASGSRSRSTRRPALPCRARRANRSSTARGISRAPGSVPAAVSPGLRTSTSCRSGSRPRSSASCSIVSRELVSISSGRLANSLGRVGELPDDPVVADSAEAHLGFERRAPGRRRARSRDRAPARRRPTRRTGPAARRSPRRAGARRRSRPVRGRRAARRPRRGSRRTSSMSSGGGACVVEQRAHLAVALHVELEVVRPGRLALGDGGDELVLAHRLQRVVRPPLLADRGARLGRELLAARRAGAVRGEDACRVGEARAACRAASGRAAAPARRPRDPAPAEASRSGRPTSPTNSVSPVSTPYGTVVVGVLVHDDADRLGRVPRRRQDLEGDVAERRAAGRRADGSIGNSTSAPSP